MSEKHSIDTLTDDLSKLKKNVSRRFTIVNNRLDVMQPQVQKMHDFIIEQKGFERGQAFYNKDGNIQINRSVWLLIVKLVTIIGGLTGLIEAIKAFTK